MPQFIDRRLNPRDKSLGNRQRFLRRIRSQVKEAVDKAVRDRSIADAAKGGSVSIPGHGIAEPFFHLSDTDGNHERVLPGNKEFVAGDQIDKPRGGGGGGSGKQGSEEGGGVDDFAFVLSEEEFLDILFEDLELPDLIKASLKETHGKEPRRAGYSNEGTTPNLSVIRTMRHSMSRRLALRRPTADQILRLDAQLTSLREIEDPDVAEQQQQVETFAQVERLKRLQKAIPYIDPIDVRYNRFEPKPVPRTKAVMFCLMDVSASMGEREKDLAKRFFILLHLFLKRTYQRVELVFIRHTHEASEVDEQEFFYGKESGGTVVSTALTKMLDVQGQRYSAADWNIYCAQVSDGDNSGSDTGRCVEMLAEKILPLTQYYAYIEIAAGRNDGSYYAPAGGKDLWRGYAELPGKAANFAMKQVASRAEIYPVFRELFARQNQKGAPR